MAPVAHLPGIASLTESLASYAIITKRNSTRNSDFNDPETVALMTISLITAFISVFAALCAFYWFVRMRRSFRHDLIMLLIQSDMTKALWLVVCPLAFFARKPIDSGSTACQVLGFLLTMSIEASDIAVLLIAVHTALFILRPRNSSGAAGLYPYRRIAYICWAIIPIILAAVVPITGGRFEDNGPQCYLPARPTWYLRGLSWIPRYIIVAAIVVTYSFLYIYVAIRFRRFRKYQRRASTVHGDDPRPNPKRDHRRDNSGDVPPTPPFTDYGFLDSARDSLAKEKDPSDHQRSVASTMSSLNFGGITPISLRRPEQSLRDPARWNPLDCAINGYFDSRVRRSSHTSFSNPAASSPRAEATIPIRLPEVIHYHPPKSSQSANGHSRWKHSRSFGSNSVTGSVSNIASSLRRGLPRANGSRQSSSSNSVCWPQEETEDTMQRSRKQQRQLRLLFVYPVIYIITWVAPFVSHILRYDGNYSLAGETLEPVALQIISIASLCIGAAVDCCFFCAWEKPWLHLRGGFWGGLASRLRIRTPSRRRQRGMGRTREERFMDAMMARVRREQEENLENMSSEAAAAAGRPSVHWTRQNTTPREWWDAVDVDDVYDDDSSETSRPQSPRIQAET
ncbi:G protein-coupled glucose receptor regulating Gpa2-domain-containing protein [Daldinia caldariorum]|uniref:G protein-coupled glucose receptor regulating Gpa2-domain-containing protein n=1 Tax=Daldinia caldariorum TaxID=326644 RepID=UPI002007A717|nr:G protein-coupled glucose receptor regulating Gpa2-domain-containing protein [Daldinia caldariorum]KAI1470522.1 G protein-coupled glucose receptor regulating Gpa2-domain-containing protein [Daldinia caldariorum]